MAAFRISIKEGVSDERHEDEVTPATTMRDIKDRLGLKGHAFCFGGNRTDSATMESISIKDGDNISVRNILDAGGSS